MSGTLLAFDFGTKSIGVAVGQRITGTARPLPAIKAQDGTPDWNLIERLLKEWQPDEIIVGLPLNMDDTEQPLTARARKFANRIHGRFGVEVKLHDERLSTVEARSGLFEQGGYRALNKGKVDSASGGYHSRKLFRAGILRRFTSSLLIAGCGVNDYICKPDKRSASGIFTKLINHFSLTNVLPHPLLITLLKR